MEGMWKRHEGDTGGTKRGHTEGTQREHGGDVGHPRCPLPPRRGSGSGRRASRRWHGHGARTPGSVRGHGRRPPAVARSAATAARRGHRPAAEDGTGLRAKPQGRAPERGLEFGAFPSPRPPARPRGLARPRPVVAAWPSRHGGDWWSPRRP